MQLLGELLGAGGRIALWACFLASLIEMSIISLISREIEDIPLIMHAFAANDLHNNVCFEKSRGIRHLLTHLSG